MVIKCIPQQHAKRRIQAVKQIVSEKTRVYGLIVSAFFVASVGQAADAPTPDPETWYLETYGSMWAEEPWTKGDQTSRFYAAQIQDHEPAGEIVTYESIPWMDGLLEMWKNDGWLRSEIAELRVTRINASTTSFMARWDDFYKAREDEFSCGWYLADLIEGQWKFTHYATIDCAAHGF